MKGKQGLIISIVLGLFAAAIVVNYLKNKEEELLHQGEERPVVVATRDILQYERVDESMVRLEQIPRKYMQPGVMTDIDEAVGKVTSAAVAQGEQLMLTKLFSFGLETGLALKIPPGSRALSLFVDDVTGVAGLIRPGNNVDVFGTFEIRSDGERVTATELLLQNIPVLAVERRMTAITPEELKRIEEERKKKEKGGGGGPEEQEYPENITVAVTNQQASRLVNAQESGVLTIVLRSQYETEGEVEVEQLTTNELLGRGKAVPRRSSGPSWREIRGTEEALGY